MQRSVHAVGADFVRAAGDGERRVVLGDVVLDIISVNLAIAGKEDIIRFVPTVADGRRAVGLVQVRHLKTPI